MNKARNIIRLVEEINPRLGQCYVLSWRFATSSRRPNVLLAHGFIYEPGGDRVIDHAWVEYENKVFDPVMDKEYPKEVYYSMFKVKSPKVYTEMEANSNGVKYGTYGPWHKINKSKVKWYPK